MNLFFDGLARVFDPGNWGGPAGYLQRILEHLGYTAAAVLVSALVAIPIGLVIGHTGRGSVIVVGVANALRALPTMGVLLLFLLWWDAGLWPITLALVFMGVPAILAGTYAGVAGVDRQTVDASTAVGMTGWQTLVRVEIPNALPLIIGGIRAALLQIVATVAIAAYAGMGGLGRFIIDGRATGDYEVMVAGSIVIALVALAVDVFLAGIGWLTAPGTGRIRIPALS